MSGPGRFVSCLRRGGSRALALGLGLAALTLPLAAGADDFDEARAAYDRGAAAYDRGDYPRAAVEFARADELTPNPVALEHALKAAMRADDPVLGMSLVGRARSRQLAGSVAEAVTAAEERFRPRVGQVTVECPSGASCRASIDGAEVRIDEARWVTTGAHDVDLEVDGRRERRTILVEPGALLRVTPSPPRSSAAPASQPAPVATPAAADGVSPLWFWVGLGATAALGGATIASGVDVLDTNDEFHASPPGPEKKQLERGGKSAETRTNVLLAATGAAGLATAVLGVFVVRWSEGSGGAARTGALALAVSPASVSVSGRY